MIIFFGPFFVFFLFFFFFLSTKCQSWGCGLCGGAAFTPANTVVIECVKFFLLTQKIIFCYMIKIIRPESIRLTDS